MREVKPWVICVLRVLAVFIFIVLPLIAFLLGCTPATAPEPTCTYIGLDGEKYKCGTDTTSARVARFRGTNDYAK